MKNIPLTKPFFSKEKRIKISHALNEILQSGNLMMGNWTNKFETNFSKFIDVKHALTTNTCTSALQITLQYFNVLKREVLVPSGSFLTNISSIKWSGGKPIFVDMNPDTLSFDLEDLKKKLTKKTKGIVWVHLTGLISKEYEKIISFAKKNNLFLIEDCAHAHGAEIDGVKAGALGSAGCFSFFPSKVLTTGTGGMITTNLKSLSDYTKQARLLGRSLNKKGEISIEGNDWFMDEIRACIGYYQLKDINKILAKTRKIANLYNKAFENFNGVQIISNKLENSGYYLYSLILDKNIDRDIIVQNLKSKYNISTKRIYLPTHQEKIFKNLEFNANTLRNTEKTLNQSICLPIYYELSFKDVDYVIKSVKYEIAHHSG